MIQLWGKLGNIFAEGSIEIRQDIRRGKCETTHGRFSQRSHREISEVIHEEVST